MFERVFEKKGGLLDLRLLQTFTGLLLSNFLFSIQIKVRDDIFQTYNENKVIKFAQVLGERFF